MTGERDKRREAARAVQSVIKATDPGRAPEGGRRFQRHPRTLPAMLIPYQDAKLLADKTVFATTKDLSAAGAAIVLYQAFEWDSFVISLSGEDGPLFILGRVQHRTPLEFGFWQLGIEWVELLDPSQHAMLQEITTLIKRLSPEIESE